MSFRLSSLGCCLTLAFFGGVTLFPNAARGQGDSRPRRAIELTETNNAEVLNRLNHLTEKKDGLKELPSEWNKAFGSLSLENRATDGGGVAPQYTPPRPPPISNKRMKDLLERKRNWTLTPDDLLPENSGEEWLDTSDTGRKHHNSNSLKQFSEGLDRRDKANSKQGDTKEDEDSDFLKSANPSANNLPQDDPNLPVEIKSTAKKLNSWLASDTTQAAFNPGETKSTFEDFFGFGKSAVPNLEQEKAQRDYIDRYRTEVLGGSAFLPSAAMPNPLVNPLGAAASPIPPAYSGGLESASGLKSIISSPTVTSLGTVSSPVAVPDLNARALNQWNSMYNPRPELPKAAPLAVPTLDIPRRRF
jgi:hypothetical protein